MSALVRSGGRRCRACVCSLAGAMLAACLTQGGCAARGYVDGMEGYVYGFPMMVMDKTREAGTAASAPGEIKAPTNQFAVMSHFPDASFRAVPRTGLDTLFAVAWADLEKEPLVLSVPDTHGRYYVIALFDMWSNVYASIGKRTTGTDAGNFLIAGPGWQGETPANVKQVYHSPTRYVWVNAQMQADGPKECEAVTALQKQYKLTPLSAWGKSYVPPTNVPIAPGVDTKTPPTELVGKMDAQAFFGQFAMLMKDNPPAPADRQMMIDLQRIGVEPGKEFELDKLPPLTAAGVRRSTEAYGLLQKGVKELKTDHGWLVMPADFANYGTDYATRAGIALIGLGGILPADVVYPSAFKDMNDKPLDARHKYVMRFAKGQTPPTNATWSVAAYDPDGYYVPNPLERYALAAWMPLRYNGDGSLDIYLQSTSPGVDREANWLPTPATGPFSITIRDYWPTDAVLKGIWKPPLIVRVD